MKYVIPEDTEVCISFGEGTYILGKLSEPITILRCPEIRGAVIDDKLTICDVTKFEARNEKNKKQREDSKIVDISQYRNK